MRLHTPIQWGGLTLLLSVSVTGSSTQTKDEFRCGKSTEPVGFGSSDSYDRLHGARQSIGMHISEILQ